MIRVNDRLEIEWRPGMTIKDLLAICNFTFPLINVTVDGDLIARDAYETFTLEDETEVRVIHLITGG
jgi:thiamine biosynthesis protein ThiS